MRAAISLRSKGVVPDDSPQLSPRTSRVGAAFQAELPALLSAEQRQSDDRRDLLAARGGVEARQCHFYPLLVLSEHIPFVAPFRETGLSAWSEERRERFARLAKQQALREARERDEAEEKFWQLEARKWTVDFAAFAASVKLERRDFDEMSFANRLQRSVFEVHFEVFGDARADENESEDDDAVDEDDADSEIDTDTAAVGSASVAAPSATPPPKVLASVRRRRANALLIGAVGKKKRKRGLRPAESLDDFAPALARIAERLQRQDFDAAIQPLLPPASVERSSSPDENEAAAVPAAPRIDLGEPRALPREPLPSKWLLRRIEALQRRARVHSCAFL